MFARSNLLSALLRKGRHETIIALSSDVINSYVIGRKLQIIKEATTLSKLLGVCTELVKKTMIDRVSNNYTFAQKTVFFFFAKSAE